METRIIECDDLPTRVDVIQVVRAGVTYCYVRPRALPALRPALPLLTSMRDLVTSASS